MFAYNKISYAIKTLVNKVNARLNEIGIMIEVAVKSQSSELPVTLICIDRIREKTVEIVIGNYDDIDIDVFLNYIVQKPQIDSLIDNIIDGLENYNNVNYIMGKPKNYTDNDKSVLLEKALVLVNRFNKQNVVLEQFIGKMNIAYKLYELTKKLDPNDPEKLNTFIELISVTYLNLLKEIESIHSDE